MTTTGQGNRQVFERDTSTERENMFGYGVNPGVVLSFGAGDPGRGS